MNDANDMTKTLYVSNGRLVDTDGNPLSRLRPVFAFGCDYEVTLSLAEPLPPDVTRLVAMLDTDFDFAEKSEVCALAELSPESMTFSMATRTRRFADVISGRSSSVGYLQIDAIHEDGTNTRVLLDRVILNGVVADSSESFAVASVRGLKISDRGTWVIDGVDTGQPARGVPGVSPSAKVSVDKDGNVILTVTDASGTTSAVVFGNLIQDIDNVLSTAPEFQFSHDGVEWHSAQEDGDIYLRFRNPAAKKPEWTDKVKFLPADINAMVTSAQEAQMAAQAASADAMSAKADAETAMGNAETARGAAVSAKVDAEIARGEAESARSDAWAARVEAESARDEAVSAKDDAECAKVEAQTLRSQTEAIYESVKATVATYYVGPAYNYGVTVDGTMLSFTWTDPADNNVVKWARTRLVMKTGGFPANENDGTVLIDLIERNQHKTVPFTWDAGVISGYYFALFTQTTGGVWNTGDDCPRFTTDELTWATIAMMSRAGTLLQYPGMEIGSVVDIKVNDLYPKLRYRLADIDYAGSFIKVSDFMYDNTRTHNSIWIPYFVPSLGEGNSAASMMQFDATESSYGATWDDVFIAGKAYYTASGEGYTKLTAGTDYQDGESVAEWQTLHGDKVYTKNHPDRAENGSNSWKESNMRQWLNSTGNDWFHKQNEYDVKSRSTGYSSGWMTGFVTGFLDLVMPVYNKTARNTVSSIAGGGGGGYDITLDKFWLPSLKEFNGGSVNDIAEGSQFAYFRDVATTNTQRIQYDEGGTARTVWLRSPNANFAHSEYNINPSGAGNHNYGHAYNAYAFQPAMCL